jgi:hypothetical protein
MDHVQLKNVALGAIVIALCGAIARRADDDATPRASIARQAGHARLA